MSYTKVNQRRRVIVNADDLGMSREVNKAIEQAFEKRLISSATIMANMPAFEEACKLVRQRHLEQRIGLHLNFTSGRPLTAGIAQSRHFCDDNGCWRRPRRVFSVTRRDALALEAEITAQFLACERQGIRPTHWDSHHHMHNELGISSVVIRMAKRLRVPYLRLAFNCGPRRVGASHAYRLLARSYQYLTTARLRLHGLAGTEYFGSARDTAEVLRSTTADVEVMVHPILSERGELIDLDGENLETRITSLSIPASQMCSYNDL